MTLQLRRRAAPQRASRRPTAWQLRHDQNGEADLQAASSENIAACGNHCRKRKLKTRHEHEKNDAELGQKSRFIARGDELQAMRPDHQTGQQVTRGRRKPYARDQADGADGGKDHDQRLDQQGVGHARLRFASHHCILPICLHSDRSQIPPMLEKFRCSALAMADGALLDGRIAEVSCRTASCSTRCPLKSGGG
jgi:hypothetical protein